jgi:hypothetical protein
MTVVATPNSASAPKMAQAATVMAGGPPPSGGLSREASARWFDGTDVKGQGRLGGGWQGHRGAPIYSGEIGGGVRYKDSR